MAFIQKHLFSVSRPHQRGWIGGNQESICRSPQKPPTKPCIAKRQFSKRGEATLSFSVTHSHGYFMVRLCWWPFPPPTSECSSAFTLFFFFEPLSLPSKPNPALKTLSNWSKPLIWLVRLGLPTECSTALPQQRLGGCSGLWAQGGGAWLASDGEKKIKKSRPQNPEGHTWSIPRWAKTADSLEQLSSLNLRASVRKWRFSY